MVSIRTLIPKWRRNDLFTKNSYEYFLFFHYTWNKDKIEYNVAPSLQELGNYKSKSKLFKKIEYL